MPQIMACGIDVIAIFNYVTILLVLWFPDWVRPPGLWHLNVSLLNDYSFKAQMMAE